MEDKEKMLKLMRFWLFGTFVIIWVAVTVYIGAALGTGMMIFRHINYWLALVLTAVLCVVWYFLYKWFLERRS